MSTVSDYDSYEIHGGKDNEDRKRVDWWTCSKNDVHFDMFATVDEIDGQNTLKVDMIKNARLYSNQNILGGANDLVNASIESLPKNRPSYNIIKSGIDTLNSRIGKARPRPYFLTIKGDYQKQDKAKKLQQFMDGFFDKEDIYAKSKQIFRDACIFKVGIFKFVEVNKDLKIERVNPLEISIDQIDGMYGNPKNIYQTKYIKTSVLLSKYPKFKEHILSSSIEQSFTKTQVCRVIEGFRRGAGGRHVIAISDATLFDEPYSDECFPYEFFRYEEALSGFYGEDVVELLAPIQIEINKVMKMISKGIELVAIPKVFLTNTASVPTVQINNKIGQIIKHAAGQPPVFYTPTAMTPEVYNYLDWLIRTGFEILGLSKMSATSEKPVGLSSGRALRTYQDIESDRFAITSQRWDSFFLRMAEKIISKAKKVYSSSDVQAIGDKFLSTIPWNQIDMKKEEYAIRIFSTNLLPTQPSAKLEMVKEFVELGAISPDRTMEMMDMPDTDKFIHERNGTANLTKYHLDKMLLEGKYIAPDPKMKMDQAYEIANDKFLDLLSQKQVDEEALELISRYVEQIEELMAPAKQAGGMAPAGMEGMLPPAGMEGMPPAGMEGMLPPVGMEGMAPAVGGI